MLKDGCRRARDRRTGAVVLIHTGPEVPEAARLLQKSGLLLWTGEEAGAPCAITNDIQDLLDLPAWVGRNRGKSPDDYTRMFSVPLESGPGEFTKFFLHGGAKLPDDNPLPPVSAAPDNKDTVEMNVREPGEFTRLFQPLLAPTVKVVKVRPEDKTTEDMAVPSTGELTQLFAAATPSPAQPVKAESAPPPALDEATRLFAAEAPVLAESKPVQRSFTDEFLAQPPPPKPAMPAAAPESRDFDRFYDPPFASNQAAMEEKLKPEAPAFAERPALREPDDFERQFGSGRSGSNPAAIETRGSLEATGVFAAPSHPVSGGDPVYSGQSEYTRVFSRPPGTMAPKPEQQPAPASASAPAAAPSPDYKRLQIIAMGLGGLLVVALIVIVILLIKR